MEHRTCVSAEVKDAAEGRVEAVFATLSVVDHDGDIIAPGAIGQQDVIVSAYGHATWKGALPVGRGRVREAGNEAVADLQFFMDTEAGREHFAIVKAMGPLQQYSFGFDILDHAPPSEAQREQGAHRVLKRLKVHEVSPVMRGAGINTRTLAAKDELALRAEVVEAARGAVASLAAAKAAFANAELREARAELKATLAKLPAAALRAANGDPTRIHVRDGRPPWPGIGNLGVVVTPEGKAYQRNVRNVTSEWKEL